jgi:prepilin signal peptidase PulO-like enzyme (type II secretory pathway)
LGLILGSFLNSWIWRTRENIKVLAASRSMCVYCRRQLGWRENIPLLSFMILDGKCKTCRRPISWRYPLVELFTALVLVLIAWYHVRFLPAFEVWRWLRDVFFVTFLIIVFVYDFLYQEVLLRIVWPGALIGFCINYFVLGYSASGGRGSTRRVPTSRIAALRQR